MSGTYFRYLLRESGRVGIKRGTGGYGDILYDLLPLAWMRVLALNPPHSHAVVIGTGTYFRPPPPLADPPPRPREGIDIGNVRRGVSC